jgi:superoxide dismutase
MDINEHAHHIVCGAAARKDIAAFFDNIKWDAVSSRIA